MHEVLFQEILKNNKEKVQESITLFRLSGKLDQPAEFISHRSSMTLVFKSDGANNRAGFRGRFRRVEGRK